MNTYTTAVSVMAALALSMPVVCQAQDPLSSLTKVKLLAKQGKTEDAIKLCDTIITKFGGKGATAQQFAYVLPYYAWEKGVTYFSAGRYDEAYAAFKAFKDEQRWRDAKQLARAKANSTGAGSREAYEPFFTYALFQMGNCRYKQGVGTDGQNNGDKSKFEDAIKCFEEYLKLIQRDKVTKTEKAQKMDGILCFMLTQAYILKENPDFKKAASYLEMSRKAKGRVPDEMAMEGLNTIVNVAISKPENVGWVYKLIESSPASYNLDPARAASNISKFYNLGQRAYKVMNDALRAGADEQAAEAARSANTLFGLVADSPAARTALVAQAKALGKYKQAVTDRGTGTQMSAAYARKWNTNIKAFVDKGAIFEGFSVMSSSVIAKDMGSNRLAKAGFQVLYDRYGKLAQPARSKDAQPTPMRNNIILQLSSLCRMTGDEANALKYEKMLDGVDMGDNNKVLAFQAMSQAVKEQNWEAVMPKAQEVMELLKEDKTNKLYLTARYMLVASQYQLGDYEKAVEAAKALISSGEMKSSEGKDGLTPQEAAKYDNDVYLFLVDAYSRLANQKPALRNDAIKAFDEYAAKYTTTDLKEAPQADKLYYTAISLLMQRANAAADDKSAEADKSTALKYCDHICKNWPTSDLYSTAELLAGSILLNSFDDASKASAMPRLERAAAAGVKLGSKSGRSTAANAYFWLASYAGDYPNEGETEEATKARRRGYAEAYWKDGDAEGDPFALPMTALYLNMVTSKEEYEAAIKRAQTTIAREANYMFKNSKPDPELEKTINTYVDSYVNGSKTYLNKTLTLEEKTAHFTSFPGVDPNDKYTNAIFRMAQISSMNQELVALKDDKSAAEKMENQIQTVFRNMTSSFKAADLTNYICVEVADHLLRYVSKFPDPSTRTEELGIAEEYYQTVIDRKKDLVADAELGLANALSYSKDVAKQNKSADLYKKVSANSDPKVAGPALLGLTRLYLRTGDAKSAIESSTKFLRNKQNSRNRQEMSLMQGEAYAKANDTKNALIAYMNVFNNNKGQIRHAGPACLAIMDIFWKRNNPSQGMAGQKGGQHSDRWMAWDTGKNYVELLRRNKFEEKMTDEEKDIFNKLVSTVQNYGSDPAVMKEDKAAKELQRNIQSGKKK